MSFGNGRCPNCGGALELDSSKEKMKCLYCGSEIVIEQAIQKITVDGIAGFDAILLSAQEAMRFEDYDKAREQFRKALSLRPQDYRILWGLYVCEIKGITWAKNHHGFVQFPGDIEENIQRAIMRYARPACQNAPEEVRAYYEQEIEKDERENNRQEESVKKKGCYIATSVYGSYDCPEVWVLRRYRDFSLANNFFGRLFIKIYYFISPKVLKVFGKKQWFKRFWRNKLDKKIIKLQRKGYSDSPYDDLM